MFQNKVEAAICLAEELTQYAGENCIVLGIPRGGAIVAYHVAAVLNLPWDIIIPRKIGAPFNREIAIGAVTQDGEPLLNHVLISRLNISESYIYRETMLETREIGRRMRLYRGNEGFPDVSGKIVILVDDGIATGYTVLAAIESLRKNNASSIITAVPVAPVEAIVMLAEKCDELLCLETYRDFLSVGSSYKDFEQNTDEEIIDLFKQRNIKTLV